MRTRDSITMRFLQYARATSVFCFGLMEETSLHFALDAVDIASAQQMGLLRDDVRIVMDASDPSSFSLASTNAIISPPEHTLPSKLFKRCGESTL